MNSHLDDHEITTAASGLELVAERKGHLDSCLSCEQEVESLRALIDARRGQLAAEAPNWNRQQQEILLRLPVNPTDRRQRRPRWLRPALAVAAVVVVAVGLGIMRPQTENGGGGAGGEVAVEQILAEVDALLADDSIPGFEFIDPGVDNPEEILKNGAS